jgi:hypothetical protein
MVADRLEWWQADVNHHEQIVAAQSALTLMARIDENHLADCTAPRHGHAWPN